MRGDGGIYKQPESQNFHCFYYLRGKKHRESTGTPDEKSARKFLRDRLKEVGADQIGIKKFTAPQMRRVTVHSLLEDLKAHFELEGQLSPQNKSHIGRADKDFGDRLALELFSRDFKAYKAKRLSDGDAKASINRPLQMLRLAYGHAIQAEELTHAPYIKLFSEKGNQRKGFCEETEFRKILSFLPTYLKDFALFGYATGMRFGEICSLKWEYVTGDVIELQAEDAKGDGDEKNARSIPMVGKDLAGILARRTAARTVKVGKTSEMAALIFHHNGKPIVDIRKAWKRAVTKAGVPHRLFHDLRRSFCKNADEAGVPRDVARSISGHRTDATYSRYNISDTKRKRKALELSQEFRERMAAEEAQESNVVAMRKEISR